MARLTAALALVLVALAALACGADAEGRAAPSACPSRCHSCLYMRGKKVLSPETVVAANSANSNARRLLTIPVRTVCTACAESFVPNKRGTACDCPPGTYLNNDKCEQCPPNTVSLGGKPGRPCRACPDGRVNNANSTKCIAVSSKNGVTAPTPAPSPVPPPPTQPTPLPPTPAPQPPAPLTCDPACAANEVCDNGVCTPIVTPPAPTPVPPPAPGPAPAPAPAPAPPATCVALLGLCSSDADCCGSGSAGSATFCNPQSSTCTYKPGGACLRNGVCGMCHPNCGGNTEPATCRYYGFDPTNSACNHSAAGGGGGECGSGSICCVVWNPVQIQPNAQNECLPAH